VAKREARVGEPDPSLWFRLVDRDRQILLLLDEHKVLTTNQIAAIAFDSVRRAQDRLRQLRELRVVFAFRDSYSTDGTSQTRFAVGYHGARLIAARKATKPPAPGAYAETLERLGLWPKLAHQLGVNDFFCQLAVQTRRRPDAALTQWWPEKRCVDFFWNNNAKLRPDAYGCWEANGAQVRFFLEHDTGTEPLSKVARKLDGYTAFTTSSFGILLFSVHSGQRERNVRAALLKEMGGREPRIVVATAARDAAHCDGPAGPVWSLLRGGSAQRCRLSELPQRGPLIERHELLDGVPFTETAFDPNDNTWTTLAETGQPPRPRKPTYERDEWS
jgi:hypothetical protein